MRPLYPFASFAEQSRKKIGATTDRHGGLSLRNPSPVGEAVPSFPVGTDLHRSRQFLSHSGCWKTTPAPFRLVRSIPPAWFGTDPPPPGRRRICPHLPSGVFAPVGYAGEAARLPLVFQEVLPAGIGPSPGRGAGGAKCK